ARKAEPQRQIQRSEPVVHRASTPQAEQADSIWQTWPNIGAALEWAVNIGACDNKFEAKNSWDKIVQAHGGLNADTRDAIRKAYYERQQEKVAQKQQPVPQAA